MSSRYSNEYINLENFDLFDGKKKKKIRKSLLEVIYSHDKYNNYYNLID